MSREKNKYLAMQIKSIFNSVFILSIIIKISQCNDVKKYSFLMPNVRPNVPDLYLCTPVKVDKSKDYFIVGFQPNASMATAHHLLLYGCGFLRDKEPVWNCGEMSGDTKSMKSNFNTHSVCDDSYQEILYAWAMDAPDLHLPPDVGFRIGQNSKVNFLVLQVHYSSVDMFKDGKTDDSGVILHYTEKPLKKLAGVILLGTAGVIPKLSETHMEAACTINENKTIYPFAYRTHTHKLGKVVSGYVVKSGNKWVQLGKRDPLTPQMFYEVEKKIAITEGDTLAARCTMKNYLDHDVNIGTTKDDEMCNFYLMYYVDSGEPLEEKYCFTPGPPFYYWRYQGLFNIPKEASLL